MPSRLSSIDMFDQPKRILVIGCPGSGKSHFSKRLSALLGIPRIHIDNLYWRADKTHITREELIAKYQEVFALDSFVLDGNYVSTLENRLSQADAVFYFDLGEAACLEGIAERFGKPRDDLPWIENQADNATLTALVHDFGKEVTPVIEASLAHHPEVNVIRFETRGEADCYLADLSREKEEVVSNP